MRQLIGGFNDTGGFDLSDFFIALVDAFKLYPDYSFLPGRGYYFRDQGENNTLVDIYKKLNLSPDLTPDGLIGCIHESEQALLNKFLHDAQTIDLLGCIQFKLYKGVKDRLQSLFLRQILNFCYYLDEILSAKADKIPRLRQEISLKSVDFRLLPDSDTQASYTSIIQQIGNETDLDSKNNKLFVILHREYGPESADDFGLFAWEAIDSLRFAIKNNDENNNCPISYGDLIAEYRAEYRKASRNKYSPKQVAVVTAPALDSTQIRNRRRQKRLQLVRYAAFGFLVAAGITLLTLATLATMGLINLVWVFPMFYFIVGGGTTAVGASGVVLNSETRTQKIARFFKSAYKKIFGPDNVNAEHQETKTNNGRGTTIAETSLPICQSPALLASAAGKLGVAVISSSSNAQRDAVSASALTTAGGPGILAQRRVADDFDGAASTVGGPGFNSWWG